MTNINYQDKMLPEALDYMILVSLVVVLFIFLMKKILCQKWKPEQKMKWQKSVIAVTQAKMLPEAWDCMISVLFVPVLFIF